jgi:hypothetical protein
MNTYRILTRDGIELATIHAASLVEAIATYPACGAPLGAVAMRVDNPRVLARQEAWTGEYPGWSLISR